MQYSVKVRNPVTLDEARRILAPAIEARQTDELARARAKRASAIRASCERAGWEK